MSDASIINRTYADGSPFHFNITMELPDVKNIGWLGTELPFPRAAAPVPAPFAARLRALLEHRVRLMRYVFECPFCRRRIEDGADDSFLGVGEIWIPDGDGYYAAPDMIVHFVEAHEYQPPKDFVDAVVALQVASLGSDFNERVWAYVHDRHPK